MNELINKAKEFAHAAHDRVKQVRKYSGLPYWTHTDAVADLVASVPHTTAMIQAANLHDTLEDTDVGFLELERTFGTEVALLVHELTDLYTSENYPQLKRAEHKALEAARLATISPEAQTIKLADLIHNTADILSHDKGFAIVYVKEKARVLAGLTKGDQTLYAIAQKQVEDAKKELDIRD